jgi:hypothetical protein
MLPHHEVITPQGLLGIRGYHDQLAEALEDSALWAFGEKFVADETLTLPRVVTVPRGGNHERSASKSPKSLRNFGIRNIRLDFFIWASSESACESIMIDIATSLDENHQGNWRSLSEDWRGLDDKWSTYGVLLVYSTQVSVSFASKEASVVKATKFTIEEVTV